MTRIIELWRYPVKSMQGERVDQLRLDSGGPLGDRRFGIRDAVTGRILTGRQCPELLLATASLEPDRDQVRIVLPDGRSTGSADPSSAHTLSGWLGRGVELVRSQGIAAEFEVPVPEEVAASYGRPAGSVYSSMTAATAFNDGAPLHLILSGSLNRMEARFGPGWAVRRFRPNLVLETGPEVLAELEWLGRRLSSGSVRMEVTAGTVRCVMLARPLSGIPDAEGILKTLAAESRMCFGLYASVLRPGTLMVGAELLSE